MKSYKFTLYLRTDKKKKNGKMPLYIRFRRIDGEEPKFSLGIDLSKEEWDEEVMRPVDPALKLLIDKETLRIEREINVKEKSHASQYYSEGYCVSFVSGEKCNLIAIEK